MTDRELKDLVAGLAIKKAKDDGFFVLQKKGDMLVETHNEIKSY